jgi:hypothetical protein
MLGKASDLTALAARLRRGFARGDGPRISAPDDDQLDIRHHLVPNPAAGRGKASALVPADDGYKIYVRREPGGTGSDRSQQRAEPATPPVPWDAATMSLMVGGRGGGRSWRLLAGDGQLLTVTVRLGPAAPLDEVNRILAEIEEALL